MTTDQRGVTPNMPAPQPLILVEFADDPFRDARDDDTLTDAEIASWLVGEWRYVCVTVTAVVGGHRCDDGAAELFDIQLGETLAWTFGADDLGNQLAESGVCDLVMPRPAVAVTERMALAA